VPGALLGKRRRGAEDAGSGGPTAGAGVEWAWELRGARGQWLGTAFLDDDDPVEEADEGAAARVVDCLVLGRDERSGHAHLLLLERASAADGRPVDDRSAVEVVRRCGVAEMLGLEDETDLFDEKNLTTLTIL
jgi:hypothetical protein